jgi:2-iminobutanoate/2-iminopropanoate deaminase
MTAVYGPYSPVRRAGNLLFVAGQVGIHPESGNAPTDVARQTERALLNLENILRKAGLSLADVVKLTVYLVDIGDFDAMNKVFEQRFDAPRPARTTVGVQELPRVAGDIKLLVEIEGVAYKESK